MKMLCASELAMANPAMKHVITWMRNPDPKSEFGRRVRDLQDRGDAHFLSILLAQGYDGILLIGADDSVVGHVFFQKHCDSIQAFSFFIKEDDRRRGYVANMLRRLLEVTRQHRVHKLRITAGGSPEMMQLWEKIEQGKTDLPCIALPQMGKGWLELKQP